MMNEMEVVKVVTGEIQIASGYDGDVLDSLRKLAFGYYYGELPEQTLEGRSSVISTDVRDAINALMAQLSPMIKSTSVEFEPSAEDDEQQAQTESDFVLKMIERADGNAAITNSIHDALLTGTSWLKVYVDEKTNDVAEVYPPDLPDEALFMLSQPTAESQTVTINATDKKTTVTRSTTVRTLKISGIAPENVIFNNNVDNSKLRFIAERKLFSVSELTEMGFDQVKINELPDAVQSQTNDARQGIYGNSDDDPQAESEHQKEVYCCYILLNKNATTSELRHVWIGGSTLLLNEPAEYIPFVWGSAIPVPHRIQGISLFEILKPIQDGKTEILRNYLDNLSALNASRLGAVEGQVNMDDLTNGRVNGIVRMRNPNAIVPLPATDIGMQSIGGLNYLDQIRTSRIGASMDMNEVQAQLMSASATAAAGQLANSEKMSGWYAHNLTETMLKPLFLMVHKVLRKDYARTVNAKARGKWEQQDTSQWEERLNTVTNLGLTTLEKAQRINALSTIIQQQTAIMEAGGNDVLTSYKKAYNAMSDWIRANNLGDPNSYITDPDGEEPQATIEGNARAQEQAKQEAFGMQQALAQQMIDAELAKQKEDLTYKYYEANQKNEQKEAELTADLIIADQKASVDLIEGVKKGENQK